MSLPDFYDRSGNVISFDEYCILQKTPGCGVAADIINRRVTVSTVWLGINHASYPDDPPLIFETMIFGGPYDTWCQRYATEADAVAGHHRVVEALLQGRDPESALLVDPRSPKIIRHKDPYWEAIL